MSIFNNFIKKANTESEADKKINLLMKVTNNKMPLKETIRLYNMLETEVMQKVPENMQVIESMELLNRVKGDWLTKNEKENLIAGVLMFNTLKGEENKKYLNEEQLKYTKQAILGTQFKDVRDEKYIEDYEAFKFKY